MKIASSLKSLKKRDLNSKLVKRRGKLYVINKKNPKFKTLLFFHGNAGKLENRIYKLNDLSKLNINYLIIAIIK